MSSKAQPAYRSLLDDVVLPKPASEKAKSSKHGVHPHTSFDIGPGSGFQTPMDSDAEAEYTDIRNAQKLALTMTPIQTQGDVSRSVRMIFRGEWAKIYKDALEEHRRVRKYLVATDLSEESTHALEWAIGTVLRDGDTLIAIYCVDEETGVSSEPPPAQDDQKQATVTKESAAKTASSAPTTAPAAGPTTTTATATAAATAVAAAAASSSLIAPSPAPSVHRGAGTGGSPLILASDHSSAGRAGSVSAHSPAPSSRERSRADEERERAVKDITDRVTKLLRKTRLQVRVIVEVIHCKNPKHLITEVIDLVNPTLVILGSRGRSALKG